MWLLLLALGCNRGERVHPDFAEGTRLTVDFGLEVGGRVRLHGFTPFSAVKGVRTATVEGGELVERTTSLRVTRAIEGGELVWDSAEPTPVPGPLASAVTRFWGQERHHAIGAHGLTTDMGDVSGETGADAADLGLLLEAVLAAPTSRVRLDDRWKVQLQGESEPGADDAVYRSWKVSGIEDHVVQIESVDWVGVPYEGGEIPDERGQRRSVVHVDGRTGRPIDLRMRDLTSKLVGVDVSATFTWE